MQMIFCPNCGRPSGFKRALGFGTLFMVVITLGLWLLAIPFYPTRCINCGLTRDSAFFENLRIHPRGAITVSCVVAGIVILLLVSNWFSSPVGEQQPVPIVQSPAYNEPVSRTSRNWGGSNTATEGPISADATTLLATYQADESAANARYKNKKLVVTGVLTGVFIPPPDVVARLAEKGSRARAVVTMGGPRPNSAEEAFFLPGIDAHSEESSFFGQQDTDAIAVGETVTLLCEWESVTRVSDMFVASPYKGKADYSISLGNCTLGQPALSQPGTIGFAHYKNDRFGFSIDYPKSFLVGEGPINGDGVSLRSTDGDAEIEVAGGNTSGSTLEEEYDLAVKQTPGELGYRRLADNWFVITWKGKGRIGYMKMFVGSASENSFRFTYPESQRAEYDKLVAGLEKSFRPGEIDQVW